MKFDPARRRQSYVEFLLRLNRDVSCDDAIRHGTLGSHGAGMLDNAVDCFLIGLFAEGRELLQKSYNLLHAAVERDEKYDGGQSTLRHWFFLAGWLLDQRVDPKVLKDAVAWTEVHCELPPKWTKLDVQLGLTPYLEAGEYETLIRRFETTGIAKPKDIRRIRGEGTMCYVLARHGLGLEYEPEEIAAALETFLKRSIKDWLGHLGAFSTTAQWLKIAHGKPGDDPIAVTLRAYDYLPNLEPPQYPPVVSAAEC